MNVPQRRASSPGPTDGSNAAGAERAEPKARGARSPSPKAKAKDGGKPESPWKTPSGSPIRAKQGTLEWPYVHRCLNWEREGACSREGCTFPHRSVQGIKAEMGNLRKRGLTRSPPVKPKAKAPAAKA